MNILLLGSGGREHAIAWKLSKSPLTKKLYIAPGNAGTCLLAKNVDINPNDFIKIGKFCRQNEINLLIVGPEEPLVNGIFDYFKSEPSLSAISILGPSLEGAKLEGSKDFAKEFMQRFNIPTAPYKTFNSQQLSDAVKFIKTMEPPYVLKADGLAAGKGVIIVNEEEQAINILSDMLINKKFGKSSEKVVIEKFLSGIELSVFVLTDGKKWILLPEAKDYKRIGIGDTGQNTGGMGSISPVPFADETFMNKVITRIIQPTIDGLLESKINYRGFIFFGLINVDGDPFVIEYNVRLGDPETESVIPRIKTDIVPLLKACADGELNDHQIEIDPRTSATIMLVSGGYPNEYKKGVLINGLNEKHQSLLFHAGTELDDQGKIVSSGGRVIAITSLDSDLKKAVQISLETQEKISFNDKYYRQDIGFDLM